MAKRKRSKRRRGLGASFTVYHETGSLRRGTLKHHKHPAATKTSAVKKACALSKKTKGGFVAVMKNGIEVAACRRGKVVK